MKTRPFWHLEYRDLIPLAEEVARHYNERCKHSQVDANELFTALEKAKNKSIQ